MDIGMDRRTVPFAVLNRAYIRIFILSRRMCPSTEKHELEHTQFAFTHTFALTRINESSTENPI